MIHPQKILVFGIAFYLAISGVYWAPGISPAFLSTLKAIIFTAATAYGLISYRFIPNNVKGLIGSLFAIGVFVFITNLFTSEIWVATDSARDFWEPALWIIALSGVRKEHYQDLFRYMGVFMIFSTVIYLAPLLVHWGLIPNHLAPDTLINSSEIASNFDHWDFKASIAGGGFAAQSTTWGVSATLTGLFAASLLLRGMKPTFGQHVRASLTVFIFAGSAAAVSSRGGTFTLLFLWAMALLFNTKNIKSSLLVLTMLFIVVLIAFDSVVAEDFFRNLEFNSFNEASLAQLTTGRVLTYAYALSIFSTSPLTGVGQVTAIHPEWNLQIHNTYLRILAESGIFSFIFLLMIIRKLINDMFKNSKRFAVSPSFENLPNVNLVVIAGFILALVEPNVIFGSFNANIIFWTSVWIITRRASCEKVPLRK